MRRRVGVVLTLLWLTSGVAHGFSGEDLVDGPWYHEIMTKAAAEDAGFSPAVAAAVAWHADYIDSYLYNPLWWAQGGFNRFKVSMAIRGELEKLHFDDLTSFEQVDRTWERYLSGTMAGLIWSYQNGDVAAARHILGVSLHALQDFYAHSSWMDLPSRRDRTWFEVHLQDRSAYELYTGSYELPDQLGVKPHGKYSASCSVLSGPGISHLMDIGCGSLSPLSSVPLCIEWRACGSARRPELSVSGVSVPDSYAYFNPPGIAIDNLWTADIAVEQRGLIGITGEQLFRAAIEVAQRHSVQWLTVIEDKMRAIGAAGFWNQVKSVRPGTVDDWKQEYERYSRFGFTFVSAGPYPTSSIGPSEEYYLRLRLKTAGDFGAGTDADIWFHAGDESFLLDYLPGAHPVLAYNDFEAGDDTVYVVGPFSSLPGSIRLENRSSSAADVARAFWNSFTSGLDSAFRSVRRTFLTLTGATADFVGTNQYTWDTAALRQIPAAGSDFSVTVDGGKEGIYRVDGSISQVRDGVDSSGEWAEYAVRLGRLHCIRESRWDYGSNSDEPFVLALLVPFPGATKSFRTQPYSDVDTGESRNIGHIFQTVRVPKDYGMISLGIAIFESDFETSRDRDRLLAEFVSAAEESTRSPIEGVLGAIGAAVAADWKLQQIEAYAFTIGGHVRTGTVLTRHVDRWIKGGESVTFDLNANRLTTWPMTARELNSASYAVTPAGRRPFEPVPRRPLSP